MSKEVKKGDKPGLPKTPADDQGRRSDDTNVARQTTLADRIMHDDRNVLKELAK